MKPEWKEAKEARETAVWAEEQIARVLDHVPSETAVRILFREIGRRGKTRIAGTKLPERQESLR